MFDYLIVCTFTELQMNRLQLTMWFDIEWTAILICVGLHQGGSLTHWPQNRLNEVPNVAIYLPVQWNKVSY